METAADATRTVKRLAVVADDFGMHAAVDRAVVELAAQGRLSATSVLSLGAHWRDSAPWLAGTPLQMPDKIPLYGRSSDAFPPPQAAPIDAI